MAFRFADRVGELGCTYDSTPSPKEVDLSGTGVGGLRTFAEAVTDGDLVNGDEFTVTIVDASGNWATYEATLDTSGAPDILELDTLIADEGTIADESSVDIYLVVSQKQLGGLLQTETQTVTTGNVTAEVGKSYELTISGLTADRNFILPSASEGDEIKVATVTDAAASYELVVLGDTGVGVVLDGTAYTAAEATRLLIRGEELHFRYGSDSVWYVKDDRRIKSSVAMTLSSALTTNASSTDTRVPFDTTVGGSGLTVVTGSSCSVTIRRAGWYNVGISLIPQSSVNAGHEYAARVGISGSGALMQRRKVFHETTSRIDSGGSRTSYLDAGDELQPLLSSETVNAGVSTPGSVTHFYVREL